jgi:hypothetical protein
MFTHISKQTLIGSLAALVLTGGLGHGFAAHAAAGGMYTDPTDTYQLSYPSNWQTFQPKGKGWDVGIQANDGYAGMLAGSIKVKDDGRHDAQDILESQAGSYGKVQGEAMYSAKHLTGVTVQYGQVKVVTKDGSRQVFRVQTFYYKGRLYDLVALNAAAATQDAKTVQRIFASWSFTTMSSGTGDGGGAGGLTGISSLGGGGSNLGGGSGAGGLAGGSGAGGLGSSGSLGGGSGAGSLGGGTRAGAGTQTFSDPAGTYQVSYPSGWQTAQVQGFDVGLQSSDKNAQALIGSAQVADQGSQNAQVVLQYVVKTIGGSAGTPSSSAKQINGTPTEFAAVEVALSNGSKAVVMVETAYFNGRLYMVIGLVDNAAASTVQQDVNDLETILNSLSFASSGGGSSGGFGGL